MGSYVVDEEPDSFIFFKRIYSDNDDINENQNLMFDFKVDYTRAPEVYSDGEEEDLENLETRTALRNHEFDAEWLIGGDKDQIQAIVYHILDLIESPCYSEIVRTLTDEIFALKEDDVIFSLERVEVEISVIVERFPGEDDGDVDVRLAVDPASDVAVEQYLETVVVENEGYCVVCMDKIEVGSHEAAAAARMPCSHVFHRTCGEAWLRSSGICPVCRAVFPVVNPKRPKPL